MNIAFFPRDEAAEKCPDARRVAPIRDWDCVSEAALCNVLRLRLTVFSLRFNSHFARLALSLTRKLGSSSEIKSESFCTFALYFARLALSLTRKLGGGSEIKSESFLYFRFVFRSPCTFAHAQVMRRLGNKKRKFLHIRFVFRSPCTNFGQQKDGRRDN